MGVYTTASAYASTAMGNNTEAVGASSTAMGDDTTAGGESSTAMGNGTEATGDFSTAMGHLTTAFGENSTAMGRSTRASGYTSTAMGSYTTASGNRSTAMGEYTTASDYGSLVIGRYNNSLSSVTTHGSADLFNPENTAFVIGNGTGTASDARSDAFKVMFNGDAYVSNKLYLGGTAITSTATELNLLSGITSIGSGILSSVNEGLNTGVRLSTANALNHGNIGNRAVDLSYQPSTSDKGATGDASTAMGRSTEASGTSSTAIGDFTTASGDMSTAMGSYTTASDYGSLVIGQYNSSGSTVTNSAIAYDADNTAFVIGNGFIDTVSELDEIVPSDAFKVMFNGDTTVSNNLTVNGNVMVSSDARLKANIVSLGATLAKLLLIDGKSYTMKNDGKQKIGVLAQDIQKVFPELVSTDDRDMLAVNYQGLVPVLINALKEQDAKMKEQDAKMKEQQADINELKVMVKQLMLDK